LVYAKFFMVIDVMVKALDDSGDAVVFRLPIGHASVG
jgi:hypothetical protein